MIVYAGLFFALSFTGLSSFADIDLLTAILIAFALTALHCRKYYSKKRFLIFMFLYVLALQFIFITIGAGLDWGYSMLLKYFYWVLIFSILFGIVQYLLLLPFWILAFYNKIYNQRFRNFLGLPEDGKSQ